MWCATRRYAVADPLTGDGVGVVCPLSPFTSNLFAITAATGLSVLAPDPSNELYGLTLASGKHCVALEGAHGSDTAGRVLDFACDDNLAYVLRGLHETSPVWIADIAVAGPNYTEVPAGSEAVTSVVLLEHQVPPANRPVVDAGNAAVDEFDSPVRVHHELDCGPTQTVADDSARSKSSTVGLLVLTLTSSSPSGTMAVRSNPAGVAATTPLARCSASRNPPSTSRTPPTFFSFRSSARVAGLVTNCTARRTRPALVANEKRCAAAVPGAPCTAPSALAPSLRVRPVSY